MPDLALVQLFFEAADVGELVCVFFVDGLEHRWSGLDQPADQRGRHVAAAYEGDGAGAGGRGCFAGYLGRRLGAHGCDLVGILRVMAPGGGADDRASLGAERRSAKRRAWVLQGDKVSEPSCRRLSFSIGGLRRD